MRVFRFFVIALLVISIDLRAGERISLIADQGLEGPALHGLEVFGEAIRARGIELLPHGKASQGNADLYVLAGLSEGGGAAAAHMKVLGIKVPRTAEALAIQRTVYMGKPALVLCGYDEVGLMYALHDAADRISRTAPGEDPLMHVTETVEEPFIRDRAVSAYTMQRVLFENFLHDEAHMEKYFDMLAANRINSFVLIFGYENGGFMAPAYPYFFNVEEFPDVELVGITPDQQAKNTEALRNLIRIAHSRGIRFCPAFWDHIYRGAVQGGGIPGASERAGSRTPHLVVGVTTENLVSYNKAAITKFLKVFPDVDAIQFRMHWESGLTREETPMFWHDMLAIIKKHNPDILLDLRAKGLPDVVIDDAVEQGINFRITTKYWMEQLGMPFHPTHINRQNQKDRRHGYADLLRYPKRYPVHWRSWSGGTARMLLWGDPEYVRRYAESAKVYDGNSFEVNEMLATKMLGEDHDAQPFDLLNPDFRYYEHEFERYWHYYQVWGRLGYNPDTPPDVWEHEFNTRFGKDAGNALMEGIHLASKVLPRVVAVSYPYKHFPTTRGWPEMQRQYDLPDYATAEGSDIQQFMNMEEFAEMLLDGSEVTPKRTPLQSSNWFRSVSLEILDRIEKAESAAGAVKGNEFISTVTDLKILSHLAMYHSYRLIAGTCYNLYLKSGDPAALDQAIRQESQARDAWSSIVEAAGDVYNKRLVFGVFEVGFPNHWDEQLKELDRGLGELKEMLADAGKGKRNSRETVSLVLEDLLQASPDGDKEPPEAVVERIGHAVPGTKLTVHARVTDPSGVKWVRLRYRHLTQFEDYMSIEMQPDQASGLYSAEIPGEFIVPDWDLIYFVEAVDQNGNGCMVPDLELGMPYIIVRTSSP